jgi:hypothetical protein
MHDNRLRSFVASLTARGLVTAMRVYSNLRQKERYDVVECALYALFRHGFVTWINAPIDGGSTILESACSIDQEFANMLLSLPPEFGLQVEALEARDRPAVVMAINSSVCDVDLVNKICSRMSDFSFAATRTITEDKCTIINNGTLLHLIASFSIASFTPLRCEKVRALLSFARIEGGSLDVTARDGNAKTAEELMFENGKRAAKNTIIPEFWKSLLNDLGVLTLRTIAYRGTFPCVLQYALPSDFPEVLCSVVQKYSLA